MSEGAAAGPERAPARARRAALEARERAILDAAAEVFAEAGWEGARMAEIARRAGISEGAVYLHFRSKAELMAALVADFWGRLTAEARAAVAAAGPDAPARLRALAAFHLGAVAERLDYMELALRVRAEGEAGRAHMRGYVAVFDGIVAEGRAAGAFGAGPELWTLRDVFYGGLEYAARSLRLRPARRAEAAAEAVTAAVLALLAPAGAAAPAGPEARLAAAAERLERAAARLEAATAAGSARD